MTDKSTVDALRKLAEDLVNDHRGIPYDVIERIDAVVATLAAEEPAEGHGLHCGHQYAPHRPTPARDGLDVERLDRALDNIERRGDLLDMTADTLAAEYAKEATAILARLSEGTDR